MCYTFAPTQSRTTSDTWAMDVDTLDIHQAEKGKGDCFHCGKTGHWANSCFLKKKEGSSGSSSKSWKGSKMNNFQKKKKDFNWKKGKGCKFKKCYVRSAKMEEGEEEESKEEEEDEQDTYVCQMGKQFKKMDKKTKIRVLAALQEDF